MAKMQNGYMGGIVGKLGTAVGYQWNGKWVLRSYQKYVKNPRTEEQQRHRELFRQQVQLAAHMRQGVMAGLTVTARQLGMTAYNLFVSLNQQAFSDNEGTLGVDYSMLRLSTGPVAPVAFGTPSVDTDCTLRVSFEANPLHTRAYKTDMVRVYVYCPALQQGYLTAPVYRKERQLAAVLPSQFAGQELVLYGMVQDERGNYSETIYITSEDALPQAGCLRTTEATVAVDGASVAAEDKKNGADLSVGPAAQSTASPPSEVSL